MEIAIGKIDRDDQVAEILEYRADYERVALSLWLKLVLLSCFLPEGLSLFIFGLRLTITRIIFLALTPVVFARLSTKISTGRYRFVATDLFVPAAGLWMFLGPAVLYGVGDSIVHSGPVVLEYLVAYMATRVMLEGNGQALSFVSFLCIVIAFVCLDAALDTATGHYVTREVVSQVTGYQKEWHGVEDEHRFGLLRAAGPIEHPILLGLIAGVGLLLASVVRIRLRWLCIAVCGLGLLISFSSAPQQCVVMGFGLLIYGKVLPGLKVKWFVLIGAIVAIAVPIFAISNSPFGFLFDTLTLSPQTAYYRLYIWNSVGPPILDSPYFGVLSDNIDYEGSVDSLWLVLSLTYGIPCAILVGLSMIGASSLPTSAPRARLTEAESRIGAVLSVLMVLFIYVSFTVHLWGSVWILVGLLMGLRAHLGELGWLNSRAAIENVAATPSRDRMETFEQRRDAIF